jgi:hypothetical protein
VVRQREQAQPLLRTLIARGQDAIEPLWHLVDDEDESVRRLIAMLLNPQ